MKVPRPPLFEGMGHAFTGALGNVDALFIVNGVQLPKPVTVILRQRRDIGLAEEAGQSVEGTYHTMAVDAALVPELVSGRDRVIIQGEAFTIGNRLDDGRAMLRFVLDGNI